MMRETPHSNGNGNGNGWKTYFLGILLAATVGLTGIAWGGHEKRLADLESAKFGERLVSVEVQESTTRDLLERVIRQLDRMEERQLRQAPRP